MTDTAPGRRKTPRGFAVYDEFPDKYGSRIRVQKSSLATDDCVWVFADHPESFELPAPVRYRLKAGGITDLAELAAMLSPSPHLNVEQAKRLIAALNEFIADHDGEASDA